VQLQRSVLYRSIVGPTDLTERCIDQLNSYFLSGFISKKSLILWASGMRRRLCVLPANLSVFVKSGSVVSNHERAQQDDECAKDFAKLVGAELLR
jgi:hypothetical protein